MALVLVVALAGSLLASLGSSTDSTTADVTDTLDTTPLTLGPTQQVSDLPPIQVTDLPPEAVQTLGLILQGGPFPYDRDGATFQNREGLLPEQPAGYYREFTVPTPGEDDRGARRLVVGEGGEAFYTDDHYASFSEVVGGGG